MIECTDEYIYYRTFGKRNRKRRKSVKRFFIFVVLFSLIFLIFFHVNGAVFTLVSDICEDTANSFALSAINQAAIGSLNQVKYSDFIKTEKNNEGDITLMSADSVKINSISREITVATTEILAKKLEHGIPVPAFAFLGVKIASGYGPIVNYEAITVAGVDCRFDGKFSSVGVNQTLHSLFVKVICKIDIEFLYKKRVVECCSEVLISEAVLVGKVPDVYLNGALFG